jgi:hypothetical protein
MSSTKQPASSRPDGPAIREEAMKISRRTVISAMCAVAALASLRLAPPSRAAEPNEIVYLTPGLDLPFWRYLSKGVEIGSREGGLFLHGA